jgi:hypothetical protein
MVADWLGNPEARLLLLEVAERYEMIANLADAGADGFEASHWRPK